MKPEHLSLEHIHKDILKMRKEIEDIKMIMQEDDLELSDYAKKAIEESRKRKKSEFVSHEEVMKRFCNL